MIRRLLSFRFIPTTRGAISRLLGLLIFVALVVYYVPARKQAFVVTAHTEILRVETLGQGAPEWSLPKVELCLRSDAPTNSASTPSWCDATRFDGGLLEPFSELTWLDGYVLTFRSLAKGYLEVFIEKRQGADPVWVTLLADAGRPDAGTAVASGEDSIEAETRTVQITDRSLMRIYLEDTIDGQSERALVPLRGYATLGDVPVRSDSLMMRAGRYEIKQTLGLFKPRSHTVEDGTFFPGDRVSFVAESAPWWYLWEDRGTPDHPTVSTRLFITAFRPDRIGFDIVATTEAAYSALQLTRVGGQPTDIPVLWTQRLVADAMPVAIATLLGLVGSIVALANAYIAPPIGQNKTQK